MAVDYVINGLTVRLKAPHSLQWLSRFGRLFCVFDQLISGHLCFGVQDNGNRYFIKYAGAPTLGYAGDRALAVSKLRELDSRYLLLNHRAFTRRIDAFETPGGFGIVFDWFEGYALAPPISQLMAFRAMPYAQRLALFDDLADFLVLASDNDFITAGISDRNILIDSEKKKALFCSADHFLPMPAVNTRGRLSGSPWFLAPEMYIPGARLDEAANVWQMGMLAHTFFGNRLEPNPGQWEGTPALYAVAKKALSSDTSKRYSLARQFLINWRQAVMDIPNHWFMR